MEARGWLQICSSIILHLGCIISETEAHCAGWLTEQWAPGIHLSPLSLKHSGYSCILSLFTWQCVSWVWDLLSGSIWVHVRYTNSSTQTLILGRAFPRCEHTPHQYSVTDGQESHQSSAKIRNCALEEGCLKDENISPPQPFWFKISVLIYFVGISKWLNLSGLWK